MSGPDPWAHRSAGMRCGTCMWYVPKRASDAADAPGAGPCGRCRRHAPTMNGYPVVFLTDWCGEHKLDETKLDESRKVGKASQISTNEPARSVGGIGPVPGSDEAFERRVRAWEHQIESVLVDMTREKTVEGLAMSAINTLPIVKLFNEEISHIRTYRKRRKYTLRPGDSSDGY